MIKKYIFQETENIYKYRINHLKGAQPTEKDCACADLSHVERGGHLLHLSLHCTEAERSL